MTKNDIIDAIVKNNQVQREDVTKVIESLMSLIKQSLTKGENVTLRGFGTFCLKKRATKNFHYAPGKYRLLPEHSIPVLKFCKNFTDQIAK